MTPNPKEAVSQAAQTEFRDGETQFLEWDITPDPLQHPSQFPRGRGLWYPIIYDPAWPVHIAAKKKVPPPALAPAPPKESEVGSYALTGMTLRECERRPIKKTLIFPHRNTEWPFRRPVPKVVREPVYEPYEKLTLPVVEELELRLTNIIKSILDRIQPHDKNDRNAHELAIRKALHLGRASVPEPGPPISLFRKYRPTKTNAKKSVEGEIKIIIGVVYSDVVTVVLYMKQ